MKTYLCTMYVGEHFGNWCSTFGYSFKHWQKGHYSNHNAETKLNQTGRRNRAGKTGRGTGRQWKTGREREGRWEGNRGMRESLELHS